MIKLFALYTFGNISSTEDISGIWETIGLRGFGTDQAEWELIRRYSTAIESPVGVKIKFPEIVLKMFAKKVNIVDVE